MARRRQNPPLNVFLNGRHVGRLIREANGAVDFRYDDSWLAWEHTQPISLSLPLREKRYVGSPVVAVFDNLLPDGNAIRRRIAERVRAEGTDTYSLLSAIGRDCVGALQFLPHDEYPSAVGSVHGKSVNDTEIGHILGNLATNPLGLDDNADFRISLAGAQEKTALLRWRKRWNEPSGTTATTHILKPQIGRLPNGIDLSHSVENEYLCLKLTSALGLPSAAVEMQNFGDHKTLVVERFDRRWTGDGRLLRVPQEDFCQACSVPSTLKYEADGGPSASTILDVLKGSDEPEGDQRLFLKSLIVFWLLAAVDGHAKNFSIFLFSGGRFRLTPLYDVLSVQPSYDAGQIRRNKMKLAMAVGNNRHYRIDTIAPRHFIETAATAGVGARRVQSIFSELIEAAPHAVEMTLSDLPDSFPDEIAASITDGLAARLRLLEMQAA